MPSQSYISKFKYLIRIDNFMRIISGKYKGRKIGSIKEKIVRPTTNKNREMIFNILKHGDKNYFKENFSDYEYVLELFCGSGILSFEALSRGVKKAILIDNNQNVLEQINRNSEKLNNQDDIITYRYNSLKLPNSNYQVDLCFIDPPYDAKLYDKTLKSLITNNWLNDNAIVIVESDKREKINFPEQLKIFDERISGKTKIIFTIFAKSC